MTYSTSVSRAVLRTTSLTAIGAALLVAGNAVAQTATATAAAGGIETVVVTAQKRTERAQDVPISIQTMSAATLAKLGVDKLQDVEFATPSVSFGDGSEQGRYGIRGIVDYSRSAGYDSRVGVYIDGVYLGRSYLNNQTLLGVQQVDVLRGPQGTLFGKNTDAGVISITTVKAPNTFKAEGEADVGNFGYYKVSGLVGGPLTDTLNAQFALTKSASDGYYKNTLLDEHNMGTDDLAGRLQLRWRPTEKLEVNLSFDDLHDRNTTLHYTYVPKAGTDVYDFNSYNDDFAKRNSWGAAATVDYAMGGGYQLTSITAIRGGDQWLQFNNETGPINYLTPVFHEETHQVSEEFRIASPKTDKYDWVAGVYYFNQLNDENTQDRWGPGLKYFPQPYPLYANKMSVYGADVETNSYAGFFNGAYRFTSWLELIGGVRYTYEHKDLSGFYSHDPYGVLAGNFSDKSDEQSTSKVTPKLGVNIRPIKHVLLFADVSTGFKSGGWNIDATSALAQEAGIRVRPETVTSYESGVKSDFWDNKARVNLTLFKERYSDFQVFTFVPVTVGTQTYQVTSLTNAGTVTSQGVEFEGQLAPMSGLTLSLTYTYDDSHYDTYIGGGGTAGGVTINANGVQTPYAPKNKIYVAADYQHALFSWADGFAHAGYSYQSSENFDPKIANPTYGYEYAIPAYDLVDARIGLMALNDKWEISLWAKNLADDQYIKFANRTALVTAAAVLYGEPRSFGLTLKAKY